MKTFLWTTLFWLIVIIALLLCLGFGNLWTQVIDNGWIEKFLPNNIQVASCDSAIASTLESIDRCTAAKDYGCNSNIEETNDSEVSLGDATVLQSLDDIMANQQIIYNYLQDSFGNINQSIANLQSAGEYAQEPIIDEREQQRLQLQAQIEALQNEMASL